MYGQFNISWQSLKPDTLQRHLRQWCYALDWYFLKIDEIYEWKVCINCNNRESSSVAQYFLLHVQQLGTWSIADLYKFLNYKKRN